MNDLNLHLNVGTTGQSPLQHPLKGIILSAVRREESRCWNKSFFHDEKRDPSLHFVPLRMTFAGCHSERPFDRLRINARRDGIVPEGKEAL
jgi:hypothetical protein